MSQYLPNEKLYNILMNKPFIFLSIFLISINAFGLSLPLVFKSEVLTDQMRAELTQSSVWKNDCPISLNDLSILTFSYYDFAGQSHSDGQIIVNKNIAQAAIQIFQELYANKFPISSPSTLISYQGNWRAAENNNVTYGFVCYQNRSGNFIQDSYGTTLTINPVQNPEIIFIPTSRYAALCTVVNHFMNCDQLFPSAKVFVLPVNGILSINRSLQLKGMVDSVAIIFKKNGFTWHGDSLQHINWKKFNFSEPRDSDNAISQSY